MSAQEIDDYLATLDEPKRGTLESLRTAILEVVPDAEQCISYNMPAFRVDGKVVAGFDAFKNHLSYFPHSGSVLPELREGPRRLRLLERHVEVPDRQAVAEGAREEADRGTAPADRGEGLGGRAHQMLRLRYPIAITSCAGTSDELTRNGRSLSSVMANTTSPDVDVTCTFET